MKEEYIPFFLIQVEMIEKGIVKKKKKKKKKKKTLNVYV
jgi:hypothetical protein